MSTSYVRQRFLDYCLPFRSRSVWPTHAIDADCYLVPRHGCATLARLSEEFLEWELVAAGIAKSLPDGLVINDVLAEDAGGVLALRHVAGDSPYSLLTSKGIASDEQTPVLCVLEDERIQRGIEAIGGRLIVARDMADLMALRSMGLPATLAADLGNRTEASLLELAARAGWDAEVVINHSLPSLEVVQTESDGTETEQSDAPPAAVPPSGETCASLGPANEALVSAPAEPRHAVKRPVELILATWSVADLDETSAGHELLIDWLVEAQFGLEYDISYIAVWRPTAAEVEKARICLSAKSYRGVGRAIRASVETSLFVIQASGRSLPDFIDGGLDLEQAARFFGDRAPIRCQDEHDRKQAAVRTIDRELFKRLIEWAHDREDVIEEAAAVTVALAYQELMQEATMARREFHQGDAASLTRSQNMVKLGSVVLSFYRESRK